MESHQLHVHGAAELSKGGFVCFQVSLLEAPVCSETPERLETVLLSFDSSFLSANKKTAHYNI